MNKERNLMREFLYASLDYYMSVEKLTRETSAHFEELMSQIKQDLENESD